MWAVLFQRDPALLTRLFIPRAEQRFILGGPLRRNSSFSTHAICTGGVGIWHAGQEGCRKSAVKQPAGAGQADDGPASGGQGGCSVARFVAVVQGDWDDAGSVSNFSGGAFGGMRLRKRRSTCPPMRQGFIRAETVPETESAAPGGGDGAISVPNGVERAIRPARRPRRRRLPIRYRRTVPESRIRPRLLPRRRDPGSTCPRPEVRPLRSSGQH